MDRSFRITEEGSQLGERLMEGSKLGFLAPDSASNEWVVCDQAYGSQMPSQFRYFLHYCCTSKTFRGTLLELGFSDSD